MYFKRLEVFGFKSFAERTKIEFEPGVTAIVGPNGCGKSNTADAIKWVLGEQRPTALRGSSMEDVIFNGANEREPVNLAEVYLTLSNEDKSLPIEYDEVTIGRRVYRSGESEYFLNKQKVRLKDIQDLFHGTGIATNSYSLIEQGKIDLVLSSKPDDRRYIFEEAAGITKYKSKKQEAIRKLEHTEENLKRVKDIIKEVERQIRSCERQAKKAERYKQKFEELKELEVKVAYKQYLKLKDENTNTSFQKQDLKNEENRILSDINEINKEIDIHRNKLHTVEEKISNLQTDNINLAGDIENNISRIELNHERIQELKAKLNSLEKQRTNFSQKIEELNSQLKDVESQLNQIQEDKLRKQNILEEKQQHLENLRQEIEDFNKLIKEKKKTIMDIVSEETKINNELTQGAANLKNISARLRRLRLDKEGVEMECQQNRQKRQRLEKSKEEIEDKLNEFKQVFENLNRNLNQIKLDISKLKDNLSDLRHQLASFKSKLGFLIDLKERLEGYSKAVKTLLIYKKEDRLPFEGLHDSLANLIQVKDGYEIPVEICLGDNLQSIIMEKESQIEEAINFLKENNLGWVNFIPLSYFKDMQFDVDKELNLKTLGSLSNYVTVSSEYKNIISYLLKDTYCVEDREQAKRYLTEYSNSNPDIKFVTKEGDLISRYNISGGGYERQEEIFLIGRDARIERLNLRCKQIEEEIATFENELKGKSEQEDRFIRDIEDIQKRLHNEEIKKANIESEINAIDEEYGRFKDEITLLNTEIEEVQQDKEDLQQKQNEYEAVLSKIRRQNEEVQQIITLNQESINKKSDEVQNILVEMTEIKSGLSSIDEIYSNRENTVNMLKSSIKETKEAIKENESEYNSSKERIESLNKQIKELTLKNEDLERDKKILNDRINAINRDKHYLSEKIRDLEIQARKKQTELSDIRKNVYDFETRTTEYSLKIDGLKERIRNSYKVNLDEIELNIEDNLDWMMIEKEITELKKQLEVMGEVSLVAIEEHQELRQRFEFLNRQREDLEEARDSLNKAIEKIDRTTARMFKETFEDIRKAFKDFFRMLFGGGRCELRLVNERNILESGIDIIAQPPGKKLQNISLLSGGEKALCAIALLFAVFKVKPSPFCVLDEIDAPLDESNIDRFTKVLREFVKTSQFIIITHNKKTIEMADVMYGVTMEESGVSKLVSVKFTEDKEKETAEIN